MILYGLQPHHNVRYQRDGMAILPRGRNLSIFWIIHIFAEQKIRGVQE